ncbi:uncharacterized protein GVI51_K03597 [Nakaseomyces glabratus]|uniref:Defect at low temperature protein 1 n=1 Tax=Candida glabrata (strain ATCC 2001 / BCRC 20586 / JCM 3761 / NBRC 0622 / NRRL Y-65 / CBS 138) TaxID=284593 RepID=DLT1_CANGA|nr:uncharacterized protein CAGL0K03751g [Nakaseomyces glabratus]Q6FN06.1 RecName: Full=Defect at low temperature protein 1 [Nakaseomyces glabratus CBS 138]KAH7583066.1 hypothetical protein J7298_03689 [Nakaseomyces glabratus]KAH7596090.1 hypothetical protein J7295_03659 [Nakaseomyces glabratus]KAH7596947.1 hypothetical protein J7294_03681 [Nakaseomyces glabratus]KAH7602719.1 hypothetical protein J7293_03674 [Nakaseomyces glabratus]KAH7611657.1 hypothetical protein J7292_03669 [Nakaseomyces gl|eukprot:XP_448388.1 uncharacterized protein CAGL0K03751g [[Candida] glabrata]
MILQEQRRLRLWLYKSSLFISVLFLIGFSIVLPVDSIVQAIQSENNGFNTIIVIGSLAVFFVAAVTILIGRMLLHKSCLKDIPRRYIPVTNADLPHKSSRKMVIHNMERSKKLSGLFKTPKDPVIHPGLEPPARCDDPNTPKILPEYLNYKICIKSATDRLKYYGLFLNSASDDVKSSQTFTDLVKSQFIKGNHNKRQVQRAKDFIELYERIRFSGDEVSRSEFIQFAENCIYFSDLMITMDITKVGLGNISTRSQLSFNIAGSSVDRKLRKLNTARSNQISRLSSGQYPDITAFRYDTSNSDYHRQETDEDDFALDDMDYFPSVPPYMIRRNSTNTVSMRIPTSNSDDQYNLGFNEIGDEDIQNNDQIRRYMSNTSKTDSFKTVIHNG